MKTKHTPGGWKVVPEEFTEDGRYFAPEIASDSDGTRGVSICTIRIGIEGADANARLIAAAPELLEALIECADRLERCAKASGTHAEMSAIAVKKYRDLIRKAEASHD